MYTDLDVAHLYTLLNGWSQADDFYLARVMAANQVLDVGCGPGQLLRRARAAGHAGRLVGVDPDQAALTIARNDSSIEWNTGVAATMAFVAEFDLVVMSGHAFQSFITDDDLVASLAAIHRALTPDGIFTFETRNPARREWEDWAAGEPFCITDHRGVPVTVSYQVLSVVGDVVTLTETTIAPDGEVLRVDEGKLRFIDPTLLADLLVSTGFSIESQFGDWDETPFDEDASELITIARA
jgi:SAM-dependent methyltransferase